MVEDLLLTDLRTSLRDPAVVKVVPRRKYLRARPKTPAVTPAQVQKVEQEVANLTDAIAVGLLKSSPALAERLHATEAELARLPRFARHPGRTSIRSSRGSRPTSSA